MPTKEKILKEFEEKYAFAIRDDQRENVRDAFLRALDTYGKEQYEAGKKAAEHSDTPFRGGKVTMELAWFYSQCKKGNAVVFAMPEGEVFSPKALENKVTQIRAQALDEIVGLINKLKQGDV